MNADRSHQSKSSVDEIRERFDNDVERFSNLETGQSATIDAPLVLQLIADAAVGVTPGAKRLLDVGCGAGNYTLKLLEYLPLEEVTLVDLSGNMLERAQQRIAAAGSVTVTAWQQDIRQVDLPRDHYDLIVAGAVLHHLRTPEEWQAVFASFYAALRLGGSLWISDLVEHSSPAVQRVMWRRYGDYLTELGGEAYRDKVVAYVEREDSPSPLLAQLELLRSVGFASVDVLHKTSVFAAFGGSKL